MPTPIHFLKDNPRADVIGVNPLEIFNADYRIQNAVAWLSSNLHLFFDRVPHQTITSVDRTVERQMELSPRTKDPANASHVRDFAVDIATNGWPTSVAEEVARAMKNDPQFLDGDGNSMLHIITELHGTGPHLHIQVDRRYWSDGVIRKDPDGQPDLALTIDGTVLAREDGIGRTIKPGTFTVPEARAAYVPDIAEKPGATQIGDTWLVVPPDQMSIIDYNMIEEVPTLRTQGNPKIKTGKSSTRIELSFEVPSIHDFNRTLRPIIAMFKRAPFVPIRNEHLEQLLIPRHPLGDSRPVPGDDGFRSESTDDDRKSPEEPITDPRAEAVTEPGKVAEADAGSVATLERKAEEAAPDKDLPVEESEVSKPAKEPELQKLLCALKDISFNTNPAYPGTFHVVMTIMVFNHFPFMDTVEFLKTDRDAAAQIELDQMRKTAWKAGDHARVVTAPAKGATYDTTPHIEDSTVFKKYYQGAMSEYYTESTIPSIGKSYKGFPYPVPRDYPVMEEASTDDFDSYRLVANFTEGNIRSFIDARHRDLKLWRDNIQVNIEGGLIEHGKGGMGRAIEEGWRNLVDLYNFITAVPGNYALRYRTAFDKLLGKDIVDDYVKGRDSDYRLVPVDEYLSSRIGEDRYKKVVQLMDEILKLGLRGIAPPTTEYHIRLDKAVVSSINATFSNKIAPIPVQAYTMPTLQHFGSDDFNVVMSIQTDDFHLISQLRYLNLMMNRTRRYFIRTMDSLTDPRSAKLRYYADMDIALLSDSGGPNMLNSLGINNVLLQDCTFSTVPEKPGWWSATLTLRQSDIDLFKLERVYSSMGITPQLVDEVYMWLQQGGPLSEEEQDLKKRAHALQEVAYRKTWEDYFEHADAPDHLPLPEYTPLEIPDWLWDAPAPRKHWDSLSKDIQSLEISNRQVERDRVARGTAAEALSFSREDVFARKSQTILGRYLGQLYIRGLNKFDPDMLLNRARAFRITQLIKLFLSDQAGREGLPPVLKKIVEDRISDASENIYTGCYPDLGLPEITNTTLKTPADFYFSHGEVMTDEIFDLLEDQKEEMDKTFDLIRELNLVDAQGVATTSERSLRNLSYRDLILRRTRIKHLRNEIQEQLSLIDVTAPEIAGLNRQTLEQQLRELEVLDAQLGGDPTEDLGKYGGELGIIAGSVDRHMQSYFWGVTSDEGRAIGDRIYNSLLHKTSAIRAKDQSLQMARAWPTFKIHLIEQDKNEWFLFDDFYSYNAVESIDVIWSAQSASKTAVIKMANLTGALTDLAADRLRESFDPTRLDTEAEQPSGGTLFLRTGMRIIIRLGYSNDPADLTSVFDGQITEVAPSEGAMEITCQSWGAELQNVVAPHEPKRINSVKTGISALFGVTSPGYGHVVKDIINDCGELRYFGKNSPFQGSDIDQTRDKDWILGVKNAFLSTIASVGQVNNANIDLLWRWTQDPRDDNIWLQFQNAYQWYDILRDQTLAYTPLTVKGFEDISFEWVVNNQTGWDAIQEVLLFNPGHICMELPYNEDHPKIQRSTLYVGPKGGYYKARDVLTRYEQTEQNLWAKDAWGAHSGPDIAAEAAALPVPISDLNGFLTKEITGKGSKWEASRIGGLPRKGGKGELKRPNYSKFHWQRDKDNHNAAELPGANLGYELVRKKRKGDYDPVREYREPDSSEVYITAFGRGSGFLEFSVKSKGKTIAIGDVPSLVSPIEGMVTARYGHLVIDGTGDWEDWTVDIHVIDPVYSPEASRFKSGAQRVKLHQPLMDLWGLEGEDRRAFKFGIKVYYGNNRAPVPVWMFAPEWAGMDIDAIKQKERRASNVGSGYLGTKAMVRVLSGVAPATQDELISPRGEIRPGYRKVQNLHFIDSFRHIIENNIIATADGGMWNRVVMSHPAEEPVARKEDAKNLSFGGFLGLSKLGNSLRTATPMVADDNIYSENLRTLNTFQKNIDTNIWEKLKAAKDFGEGGEIPLFMRVGNTILSNGVSQMYQGEVRILMDPTMKPWDQVYMYDPVSDMVGPFEIDTVHHHIDFTSGAWTSVKPKAIVFQQDLASTVDFDLARNIQGVLGAGAGLSALGGAAFGAAFGVTGLPALGGAAVGAAVGLGAFVGTGAADDLWYATIGWLYGRQPITISGLWYKGAPYTAGLEGMRRDDVLVHIQDNIERYTNIAGQLTDTVR